MNIKEQVRRNAVALISLVIAITSLGYNTWRNEASENNRTQRLHKTWNEFSPDLDSSEHAKEAIILAIDAVRSDALILLQRLD
jgi:uncharacterized membrane protein YebE (DUF533 family)